MGYGVWERCDMEVGWGRQEAMWEEGAGMPWGGMPWGGMQRRDVMGWDAEVGCRGGMPWGGLPTTKAEQDPPWGHAVRAHLSSLIFAARENPRFAPNPTSRITLDPPWVRVLCQHLSG